MEIVGIPNSFNHSVLEETVRGVFKKIGVEIDEWDVHACHRLKEKERAIVKIVNRKDYLQILRVKKELKSTLTRQSWTFLRAPKFSLMKVYVLITEASGINAKN